jgi:crotonobetainyl-CoA:carnitine CoA-transferase CaiB-like acyl-CoA transferase
MRPVRGTVARAEHAAGPLRGTLVLDLGQTAVGPVTAMLLGHLGAVVVKVEMPRGEIGRYDTSRKHGGGFTFLSTNLGKYGIVLDFKDPVDHEHALGLVTRADVVIDNFRSPDVMRRLGLDYFDVLRRVNPTLVYLQSSSFLGRGPFSSLPSFEWAAQATSGFTGSTGTRGGRPEFSRGTAYLDWTSAMMNVVAVLSGLHRRRVTGEGCMLSTSQFGTSVFAGASRLASYASGDGAPPRLGHDFGTHMLDRAFEAADGFITVCAPTPAVWRRLAVAVGLPADAPVDATGADLEPIFKSVTTADWIECLRAARVPAGEVGAARTVVERLRTESQTAAEGLLRTHDAPRGGVLYPAPPWEVVDADDVAPRPAPELGEHDDLVRRLVPPVPLPTPRDATVPGRWTMSLLASAEPLAGVEVVAVGTGLAAGTACTILAALGARVTKVLPPWDDAAAASDGAAFDPVPRQRDGAVAVETLDLRDAGDRSRLDALVRDASAAIVSGPMRFRRAFALDEADVRDVSPGIVYCGLTGYGTRGPLADAPATELDVQVTAGMTLQLGRRDEAPVRQGFHLVAVNTGYAAAQAVLAGLLAGEEADGRSRHFEVSLLRTATVLNGWNITAESGNDGVDGKQVLAYGWSPDHGYTCSDRQVLISLRNNEEGWVKLLVALDCVELLADDRFNTLERLRANEWQLPPLLAKTTSRLTSDELCRIVNDAGGDLVPVLEPHEVLHHPQTLAQGLVEPGSAVVKVPIHLVTR